MLRSLSTVAAWRWLYLWIALAFGTGLSGAAEAGQSRRWTFEQPAYGSQASNVADHCYVLRQGVWHIFYTHIPTVEQPTQFIGHAISLDLREWTELPPVLISGPGQPDWRRYGVWAPYVIADPVNGGYVMAYAGNALTQAQRIGFLRSTDLISWHEVAAPPFEPLPEHYRWSAQNYSNCRDPHLLREGDTWHLIFAARSVDSTAAIGHATSTDLLSWDQQPPLMTAGVPGGWPDMESPALIWFGGRYELIYSYQGVRLGRATTIDGPWPGEENAQLDPLGSAGELVPWGNGLMFSRRRSDPCRPGHSVVWTDSLDTTTWPFAAEPWPRLAEWVEESGDAFSGQPTFGDGAQARGEIPSEPTHLFMLSSREAHPEPNVSVQCTYERGGTPRGFLRSAPFVLQSDSAAVRIAGANSPDSVFVHLRDACTNRVYAAFSGGAAGLERQSVNVAAGRGGHVEWLLRDDLDRPGGWLDIDDLEVTATPGLPDIAPGPMLSWLYPVGGEDLEPGSRPTVAWNGASSATLDSIEVHLTYDGGATLLLLNQYGGGRSSFRWTVPDTVALDARLRLVAYAKTGARTCTTTGPLMIGRTVDVTPGLSSAASLHVRYAADGPWLEGSVPAIAGGGNASLELFDLRGRKLAEIWQGSGGESFRVPVPGTDGDGRTLAAGIYFARLRTPEVIRTATVYLPAVE